MSKKNELKDLTDRIHNASKIVISTHKHPDGDGLGSEIALFHALRKINKDVRILNLDKVPSRYKFLNTDQHIESYILEHTPLEQTDLALILDTNDLRLLGDLFPKLESVCDRILFVDHHLPLKSGPTPTSGSYIDVNAASTGEMIFDIIKSLNIDLNKDIARALYTSIIFDTKFFRDIRHSGQSHRIAAELLEYEKNPMEVSQNIFGNYTVGKLGFLSQMLGQVEYLENQSLAVLIVKKADILKYQLTYDDSLDVIDMVMNVKSLQASVLFLEMDKPQSYKVSLRSKGKINVCAIAESIGGGGHFYASGAFVQGDLNFFKTTIIDALKAYL